MKITSEDLLEYGLIDDVLDEPLIGAHRDKKRAVEVLKKYYLDSVKELQKLSTQEMLDRRYNKLISIGAFTEGENK